MIEKLNNYEEQISILSKEIRGLARKYYSARVKYARLKAYFDKETAKEIFMNHDKKVFGIEKAVLSMLKRIADAGDSKVWDKYEEMLVSRAEYKALDIAIDNMKSEKIGIQTVMKYKLDGEKFSK